MMATAAKLPPALLAPVLDAIPGWLREQYPKRWSVWVASWDPVKEKWHKKPVLPMSLETGLSSRRAWFSFDQAVQGYETLALCADGGVGFNMTNVQDLVGIDLDHCVANDVIAEWALQILAKADSYAEISPSGTGLRIFVKGSVPEDWTNHERGIEVYAGNAPRFLTVTGLRAMYGTTDVHPAPAGFLDWLAATYRKVREPASLSDQPDWMPAILEEDQVPAVESLNLPAQVQGFMLGTLEVMDRSGALQAACVELYNATATPDGQLQDSLVLSLLYHGVTTWAVAMDHRRQDPDRALQYLWEHHCLKARGKAAPAISDFEVVELTPEEQAEEAVVKQGIIDRFQLHDLTDFTAGEVAPYLIKGLLPKAELGVLFGESGSGKSFFAWDMAVHIAQGREWRGRRVRQGNIVYVAAEGVGGFRKRVKAYGQHHGLDLAAIPIKVLADAPNFLSTEDHKKVASRIKEAWGGADLIIIDTLAQTTPGGNENAAEDMGKALSHLKALHRATGAMVLLVHHAGKDTSKGARGWSGLKAAADVEIEVSRLEKCRIARVSKSKDDEDGIEFGFELEVVSIGMDDDGDVITSCVAVEAQIDKSKPVAAFKPGSVLQQMVLEAVSEIAAYQSAGIEVDAVIELVLPNVPKDEGGKRDTRKQRVKKALDRLCSHDDSPIFMEDGCICLA